MVMDMTSVCSLRTSIVSCPHCNEKLVVEVGVGIDVGPSISSLQETECIHCRKTFAEYVSGPIVGVRSYKCACNCLECRIDRAELW
jgi:transposase-like protein